MTTEVDFALTLQPVSSFLRQCLVWFGFFLSSKRKGTGKKRKKSICQFVDFLSSLLDSHPRGELGLRDKTRTGGC